MRKIINYNMLTDDSFSGSPSKFPQIITIGILLLVVCTFSNCKKTESPPTYLFSTAGLAYIQLRQGEYFIYKDSVSNTSDSIVVTTSSLESVTYSFTGYKGSYIGDNYRLTLSKIDSSRTTVWLDGNASPNLSSNIYMTHTDNEPGYLFRYPPCNCGLEKNIASMVVEGKTYTDIVLTTNDPEQSGGLKSSYYFAKGVGLIRRSETDNLGNTQTFTLLRNN